MPLFVVTGFDVENSTQARLEARPAHVARLKELQANGQLILAGPCPISHDEPNLGMQGSVMVLDFADRTTLDVWLADEPYLKHGVYSHVDVKPFVQALAKV